MLHREHAIPAYVGEKETSVEMDALVAHLDRGWDLLHQGRLGQAESVGQQALQLEPDCPEALTLLGAVAAANGDVAEAQERFQQALDEDPEYLDALVYGAELELHSAGDLGRAAQMIDDAARLLDGSTPEIELLKAELAIARGKPKQGVAGLQAAIALELPDEALRLRCARAALDAEHPELALQVLEPVTDTHEWAGDAHYMRGIALELAGRPREAMVAMLAARDADERGHDVSRRMPAAAFAALVDQAISNLPQAARQLLASCDRVVVERPPAELVADGVDPRALVYVAARGSGPGTRRSHPSLVFVYRDNLERLVELKEGLADELTHALNDELSPLLDADG